MATADSYGIAGLTRDGIFRSWSGVSGPRSKTNVAAIAPGGYAEFSALLTDGTVSFGPNLSMFSNVVAIADNFTGISHLICLRNDGTVVAASLPSNGPTNVPTGLSNVVAVASGSAHGLALKKDGTVVAWGGNTNVPVGLSNVVAIAAGAGHSLALKADGRVVAWGSNWNGQTNVPPTLTNVAAIFAGPDYSAAIVGDSPPTLLSQPPDETVWVGRPVTFTVKAIGSGPLHQQWQFNGENIEGATNSWYRVDQATLSHSGVYNFIISNSRGIAASREAILTVRPNPDLVMQPRSRTNVFGDSATFTVTVQSPEPVSYQWYFNGSPINGGTQSGLTVSNASPGTAGSYWCVISNSFNVVTSSAAQLSVVLPIQPTNRTSWIGGTAIFTATTAGSLPITYQWYFNGIALDGASSSSLVLTDLALDQTGDYWMAATSQFGSATSSVVWLSVNAIATWGNGSEIPRNLPSISAIGAGWYHYFAQRGDGPPIVWGIYAGGGGMGNVPATVPAGLTNVVATAGGQRHSLALLSDGSIHAWGDNSFGQASNPGVTNIVAIAGGTFNSFALGRDGHVTAWGSDYYGAASVPAGLSDVVDIASRTDHCLALRANGTITAWGNNEYGQRTIPPSLSNIVAVAAGDRHSVVLRDNGTVVAWGNNSFGQTNVPSGLSNVVAITAGFYHTLGLRMDGSIVAWGWNNYGQTNVPADLSNVVAIAAGGYFNLALVRGGLSAPGVCAQSPTWNNGLFAIEVPSVRGKNYHLQFRDSFTNSHWTLSPPFPGDGTVKVLLDLNASVPTRFYRVWQKP